MRTCSILAPLVAAFPLLASCSRDDTRRAPADTPAATQSPARADTSASTQPVPATDAWTVTPAGIGQIRVGLDTADVRRFGGDFVAPKPTAECSYVHPKSTPPGVMVMLARGRVARVDVDSAGVRTDAGIAVGDSASRVLSAYGSRVSATPHKYLPGGQFLTVRPAAADDSTLRIVFETDSSRVVRFRAGRMPEVGWVERCG